MKKHSIKIICTCVVLITLFATGCQSQPAVGAHREGYEVKPPEWGQWAAGEEYADYANLLALFSDRTKFASVTVPLDYANPSAGTLDVAVLKVEAKNSSERWGSILFNPGGPGGDGLIYGLLFNYLWSGANPIAASGSGALFQELTEHYDLVGFSPRGLGASTKLICSSDTHIVPELILSADDSEANIAANMQNARAIAEALKANPLTQYINTEATVRDMDVIREVLGDEKLNFMGISYGTWLGTQYASLFPDRVGKMLFIGETDITGTWNEALLLQEMGMQRVVEKMLVPYAADNPWVFCLGETQTQVKDAISSLHGELKHVTMKALDKHISYKENAHLALLTLRAGLVIKDLLSQEQAQNIDDLNQLLDNADFDVHPQYIEQLSGIAKTLAQEYFDLVNKKQQPVKLDDSDAVWWAVQCMDTKNAYDADAWALQSRLHSVNHPQFGGFYIDNPCLFWDKPLTDRPPLENIPSDASILIVQSEYDPYTPLEGALRTFTALPQAGMIVLKGDYTHCIVLPYGNEELDRRVAEFFLSDKRPPRLSIIEGNAMPMLPEGPTQ